MYPKPKKKEKGKLGKRKCKHCGEKFQKVYPLQSMCSINCAAADARLKEERKKKNETFKRKVNLLSPDKYRSKYVQPIINEIARLIDHGQPCIATGNYQGKMAGGHFIAVGSNRTLALNLHNIHIQSYHSNGPKGGDNIRYSNGIKEIYGIEYLEYMLSLQKTPVIKLTKGDLKEIKVIAQEIRKELKKDLKVRSPKERIKLREEVNRRLNIY